MVTDIVSAMRMCAGDTLGRRTALMLSVMGVALPSTLIGCLPAYSMIGQVCGKAIVIDAPRTTVC